MVTNKIQTPGGDGHPLCSRCGCRVAPLVYGLPFFDEEFERQIEAGKIALGGCTLGSATWGCTWCDTTYEKPPHPGRPWTTGSPIAIPTNVVRTTGDQVEGWVTVSSDMPWTARLRIEEERWTAQGEDLFGALRALRRKTDQLDLRMCLQAARRDAYRCRITTPSTGHLVSLLTPGRPATLDDTAWIFDPIPYELTATVEEQDRHHTEWAATLQ